MEKGVTELQANMAAYLSHLQVGKEFQHPFKNSYFTMIFIALYPDIKVISVCICIAWCFAFASIAVLASDEAHPRTKDLENPVVLNLSHLCVLIV